MKINLKNKKKEEKTFADTNRLFNGRNDAIKFAGDYVSIILKVKRKAAQEEPKPKPTKAKTKCKKSPFKLHKKFINKIKNDKKI